MTKNAVVCGAGGFIGHHLCKYLVSKGYYVRGVDLKRPEFEATHAHEFFLLDLRKPADAHTAMMHFADLPITDHPEIDEVYQLAADMGGMGFIHSAELDILFNNMQINRNMVEAAMLCGVQRYFFSSSVCVYPDMKHGDPMVYESDVYPAMPDNEYGWEKLYAERVALTVARHSSMQVRIARFENTYGPLGTWRGGREKAPAALCRKVAEASEGGEVEVWGDGTAERVFTYVDDLVDGIYKLMQSGYGHPVNIGSDQVVTVNELAQAVINLSGKELTIKHVEGPVGVLSRNFSHDIMKSLGWSAKHSLQHGLEKTYPWVLQQVMFSSPPWQRSSL